MQAKTIFRFEYSDGSGIFYRGDAKSLADDMAFDTVTRHPGPWQDTPIANNLTINQLSISKYRFGFATIEQLRSWFYNDEFLHQLHENQVVIAEYVCYTKDVIVGNAQAIFKRDKMIGKTQYNIRDYFKL